MHRKSNALNFCHVCGGGEFAHVPVLWPALVSAWGLSDEESHYVDIQQGTHCVACGSNVRSIALARAIMRVRGAEELLTRFVSAPREANLRVLEINEAGTLHPILKQLPRHTLASFPECDMTDLPFPAGAFDVVVHSDTLEHVADPMKGLQECRRVLDSSGALVFTVPVVIGRLNRSRLGLPPSYHGCEGATDPGMLVHTEFGADVWALVMSAGFVNCEFVSFQFPAGLAIVAR